MHQLLLHLINIYIFLQTFPFLLRLAFLNVSNSFFFNNVIFKIYRIHIPINSHVKLLWGCLKLITQIRAQTEYFARMSSFLSHSDFFNSHQTEAKPVLYMHWFNVFHDTLLYIPQMGNNDQLRNSYMLFLQFKMVQKY